MVLAGASPTAATVWTLDLGRQLVGMDRYQNRGVQFARQGRASGVPRRWHEMMGLVDDDPVRPAGLGAQLG
jgi:hypothetical protein